MESIAGMNRTGRRLAGPGASLVEVVDEGDLKHTAVVFEPVYRDHPSLSGDLQAHLGFMEQPDITGLGRLAVHRAGEGAFVYPTGTVWSIAEVVRELAAEGEAGGVKAGLELCFLAAEILVEAADKEVESGLASHGSVDPWKLALKADGQVVVLGYGLPRPEIEVFLDDDTQLPSEDGFRYCAPETLAAEPFSDIGSDLFSLTLVALELMVGRPVYDGLVEDIRQKATRGEAVRKLYQWRDRLAEPIRDVLGKALKPDPDARHRDGLDFVYSMHDLLGGIDSGDGPSLRELVTRVRARQKRGKAVVGGNTGALTRSELAELAADIDNEGVPTRIPDPRQPRPDESDREDEDGEKPRWKRSTRNASEPAANPRRGRRRGRRSKERSEASKSSDGSSSTSSARERLLARLRGRDGESGPSPRRRRRSGSSDLPDRPRRRGRRRRGSDDESDDDIDTSVDTSEEETRVEDAEDVRAALEASKADDEERTEVQDADAVGEALSGSSEGDADDADDADDETDGESAEDADVSEDEDAAEDDDADGADDADEEEEPTNRGRRGRRGRSGRRRRPGGRAAALLQRLRSSSGEHGPDDVDSDADDEADDDTSDTGDTEDNDESVDGSDDASDVDADDTEPASGPRIGRSSRRRRGDSAPFPKPTAPPLPEEAREEPRGSDDDAIEARDSADDFSDAGTIVPGRDSEEPEGPEPEESPAGRTVEVTFGGRTVTVASGPTGATLREAALDALSLAETDLLGHTVAWHRLVGAAGDVPLDSPVRDEALTLERIENTIRPVRFEVEATSGSTPRIVETVTATAIPVARLKRALGTLLGLSGPESLAAFDLVVDGDVLADHAVLADVAPSSGPLHVQVRS